jgi:hypothetical protein
MKSLPLIFVAVVAAGSGAACGSLDGSPGKPSVLTTVTGELSLTASAPSMPDHVHVAIIWQTSIPGEFNVAEDIPVEAVFPSQYVLRLTDPPPAAVFVSYGPIRYANGVVVAYEDLNENGKLDLVPDDAGAFIDRIVATNASLWLGRHRRRDASRRIPHAGRAGTHLLRGRDELREPDLSDHGALRSVDELRLSADLPRRRRCAAVRLALPVMLVATPL